MAGQDEKRKHRNHEDVGADPIRDAQSKMLSGGRQGSDEP
jgi:hypothetical protein